MLINGCLKEVGRRNEWSSQRSSNRRGGEPGCGPLMGGKAGRSILAGDRPRLGPEGAFLFGDWDIVGSLESCFCYEPEAAESVEILHRWPFPVCVHLYSEHQIKRNKSLNQCLFTQKEISIVKIYHMVQISWIACQVFIAKWILLSIDQYQIRKTLFGKSSGVNSRHMFILIIKTMDFVVGFSH